MSATELAQVEALLQRILPDPAGFGERVFQQLMDRLGTELPLGDSPNAGPTNGSVADEGPADRNLLLAAAVGACDCWGEDPSCPICSGEGSAGWTEPDTRLYDEYIKPAVLRAKPEGKQPVEQQPTEGDRNEPHVA
jgi:hypothetical protein